MIHYGGAKAFTMQQIERFANIQRNPNGGTGACQSVLNV